MAANHNSADARFRILSRLDLVAEYKALGVQFTKESPNQGGWLECFAAGRDENNPSAACNVAGSGSALGRYKDFGANGGIGDACSFWDFALRHGNWPDFKTLFAHFADKVGEKIGRGRPKRNPDDLLEFVPWNDSLAQLWCLSKPGITLDALKLAGCRIASYPKKSKQFQVLAMPVYGPQLIDAEPCSYILWNITGGDLPIWGKGSKDGKPLSHVKMKTLEGTPAGLVNFHALTKLTAAREAATSGQPVPELTIWKVEGPTDAMALQLAIPPELRDTHLVVTNSGGSTQNISGDIARLFSGHRVVVLHDADGPGELGAAKWLDALHGIARSVVQVKLPYQVAKKKGLDLRDFLGGVQCRELDASELPVKIDGPARSFDDVLALPTARQSSVNSNSATAAPSGPVVAAASAAEEAPFDPTIQPGGNHASNGQTDGSSFPPQTFHYETLANILRIDVLGETQAGAVCVWSRSRKTEYQIRDIDRLSFCRVLQYFGPESQQVILDDGEEDASKASVKQVRNAICALAGGKPADDELRHGAGCWRSNDETGAESIAAAGHDSILVCRPDGTTTSFNSPHSNGQLFKFSREEWFHLDELKFYIGEAGDHAWCESVIDEAVALFGKWRWLQPDGSDPDICPTIVVGLILASFIQTVWTWRPLVGVIGESNSGKSMFFQTLHAILGPISKRFEGVTAAGIRQTIQNTANVILCDEFEKNPHRAEILEMFRAASRGGTVVKGTANQQKAKEFTLQHIVWLAAIEITLKRQPDKNRFITLELLPPLAENKNKLRIQPESELRTLGQKLLAIAIRHGIAAKAMADRLKSHPIEKSHVDARIMESYCVPAAAIATACGRNDDAAGKIIDELLVIADTDKEKPSDKDDLIHAILSANIRFPHGVEKSVGELVQSSMSEDLDALERHGIAIKSIKGKNDDATKCIWFDHRDVVKKLLHNTEWRGQSIDQILRRGQHVVDGHSRQRIAGRRSYGVAMRWDGFRNEFLGKPIDTATDQNGNSHADAEFKYPDGISNGHSADLFNDDGSGDF